MHKHVNNIFIKALTIWLLMVLTFQGVSASALLPHNSALAPSLASKPLAYIQQTDTEFTIIEDTSFLEEMLKRKRKDAERIYFNLLKEKAEKIGVSRTYLNTLIKDHLEKMTAKNEALSETKKSAVTSKWRTPLFEIKTCLRLYEQLYLEEINWRHNDQEVFKTNRWRVSASLAYHYYNSNENERKELLEELIQIELKVFQEVRAQKITDKDFAEMIVKNNLTKGLFYLDYQYSEAMEVLDDINDLRSDFGNYYMGSRGYWDLEKSMGREGLTRKVLNIGEKYWIIAHGTYNDNRNGSAVTSRPLAGIEALLSIIIDGELRPGPGYDSPDMSVLTNRMTAMDSATYGPFYVLFTRAIKYKTTRGKGQWSDSNSILKKYHAVYLVPDPRDKAFLTAGAHKAVELGFMEESDAELAVSKILTFEEFVQKDEEGNIPQLLVPGDRVQNPKELDLQEKVNPLASEIVRNIHILKQNGVDVILGGTDLSTLSAKNISKYLKAFCVIKDDETILKLLEHRIKGESIKLFDAVFNPRKRLEDRKSEGMVPIKMVHVRGGRGAAGITEEFRDLTKRELIEITILPGAVDDGRSWADMAFYLDATGLPDVGKSHTNLGRDVSAVDFVGRRLVSSDKKYSKEEGHELLEEAIKGFKNADHITESLEVKNIIDSFRQLNQEKKKEALFFIEAFKARIDWEKERKQNVIDIQKLPFRSILIVGANEHSRSWQEAADKFGKFVDSAGAVILPTEERLHAMAILEDGTILPTENAINEVSKKAEYFYFTVGPRSFVDKDILLLLFLAIAGREPTEEEKSKVEQLRLAGYEDLKEISINLLKNRSDEAKKKAADFIERNLSYLSAHPKIRIQEDAIRAVREADLINYGPTDIESNMASALIYPPIASAIKENKNAVKILVANASDPNKIEPLGTTAASQLERLYRYLSNQQRYAVKNPDISANPVSDFVQYVIGRDGNYSTPGMTSYIDFNSSEIRGLGVYPVGVDIEMQSLDTENFSPEQRDRYFTTKRGRYNAALSVDTILSVYLINELGFSLDNIKGDQRVGIRTKSSERMLQANSLYKDPIEREHVLGVLRMILPIAKAFGVTSEELDLLEKAALLHDLGRAGIDIGLRDKVVKLALGDHKIDFLYMRNTQLGKTLYGDSYEPTPEFLDNAHNIIVEKSQVQIEDRLKEYSVNAKKKESFIKELDALGIKIRGEKVFLSEAIKNNLFILHNHAECSVKTVCEIIAQLNFAITKPLEQLIRHHTRPYGEHLPKNMNSRTEFLLQILFAADNIETCNNVGRANTSRQKRTGRLTLDGGNFSTLETLRKNVEKGRLKKEMYPPLEELIISEEPELRKAILLSRKETDYPPEDKLFLASQWAQTFIDTALMQAYEAKKLDQNIIIALETSMIPKEQMPYIQGLLVELTRVSNAKGLNNIFIKRDLGLALADAVRKFTNETGTPDPNIIFLGDHTVLEKDVFDTFREGTDPDKWAFFAGVELPEEMPDNNYMRILEMITKAMDLWAGKNNLEDTRFLKIIQEGKRFYKFIVPESEPIEYEQLKDIYKAQLSVSHV